jgi:tRNA(Ile)-lysidine synthase
MGWVEDPTNQNENFLRPRLRAFEDMLAAEGLTPHRLSQTIQKLAAAKNILSDITQKSVADVCVFYPEGYATLHRAGLCALRDEIARRVLSHVLRSIAPTDYPPGTPLVDRLYQALQQEGFSGQTAAGCDVQPLGDAQILVVREQAAMAPRQALRTDMCWDGRFFVTGHIESFESKWDIAPLAQEGVAALRKHLAAEDPARDRLESLPGRVRASLPAVWDGENILYVPHLSWVSPGAPSHGAALACRWHLEGAAQDRYGRDCLIPPEGYIIEDDKFL